MNDVLRILDRLLKKGGYAIKNHSAYNLLHIENFQNNSLLKGVYYVFDK